MKNKQEFVKKMNIASESFLAIESFYGKIKDNPQMKSRLINSIKKEINKITRIKEVSEYSPINHLSIFFDPVKFDWLRAGYWERFYKER